MNHWTQQAIYITNYSPLIGAQGIELAPGRPTEPRTVFEWPPMALDIEFHEKKWQPVIVSNNILNGEILSLLPSEMKKSPWELIFLLLISSNDKKTIQTLLDTGLSPRQGLFAYLRLLGAALKRSETFDDIPDYRKIQEKDLIM